jgi:hypothetical protein
MGQVTTWQMTEQEHLAYIEKHPIKPTKKERPVNFTTDYPYYKWRGKKQLIADRMKNRKSQEFSRLGNISTSIFYQTGGI